MEVSLKQINSAALKFLTPLSLEETYTTIINEAIKLVKADYGTIFLTRNDKLERVYSSHHLLYKFNARKRGNIYQVYRKNKAAVFPIDVTGKVHPELLKLKISQTAAIPLSYRQKSIGVLTLSFVRSNKLTRNEMHILHLLAALATLSIRRMQAYDETKKALEMRDAFISTASHELRTPLTTLHGYIQLLQRRLAKTNSVEVRWVNQLYSQSSRLTQLISQLMETHKIRTGRSEYEFRECHLTDIVDQAICEFKLLFPQRVLVYDFAITADSDFIIGDSAKLINVIVSLLHNAAKFSPPEKPIELSLHSNSVSFLLELRDHGSGIPKKKLPYIFDEINEGEKQYNQGMGTGLFIARQVLAKHQGLIEVASKPTNGTVIKLTLPRIRLEH